MAKKPYPTFASETEEAEWLDAHADELADYWDVPSPLEQVALQHELSNVKRTPPEKLAALDARVKAKTEQIALRVPVADLEKARLLADNRGIGYQTLLKMLIREGLDREARRASGG
jgi:predicted DNA binding CopG/RHH family protein